MKNFLYLVHGHHELVRNYDYLKTRKDSGLIQSTYDAPSEGAHYFPGATWAEGRNGLLEKAKELSEEYEYYIFLDDDVEFERGGFDELEKQLLKLKPAVAVPVFVPKTAHTVLALGISYARSLFIPIASYQVTRFADGQVMVFHRDVIEDGLLMPLLNKFDDISWWFTSSTQQILMHNLYPKTALQLNTIAVTNESHRDYTRNSYIDKQENWLHEQFLNAVYNPRYFAVNLLTLQGLRYAFNKYHLGEFPRVAKEYVLTLTQTLFYKKKDTHRLDQEFIKKIFRQNSEMYNRYFEGKDN